MLYSQSVPILFDSSTRGVWDVFRASHISTSLNDSFKVQLNGRPEEAYSQLESHRFDQAPVIFQNHIVGWVAREHLRGANKVKSVMVPLEKSSIVSADASIASVLQLLGRYDHGFVFTAGDAGLLGFMVHSDTDRHAARSYFYLLVSAIEMLLSTLVRANVPFEAQRLAMRPDMADRYAEASINDQEADLVEYLYMEELVDLFLTTPYASDSTIWSRAYTSRLHELNKFRPVVMHPARSIAGSGSSAQLAALARGAMDVVAKLQEIAPQATY